MGALLAGLVVFGLLAFLVFTAIDTERDADDVPGALTMGVWFAYLVHADTVVTAAWITTGRVPVPKAVAFAVGALIGLAGFWLFVRSARTLVHEGAFNGLLTTRLVQSGPYRWMRHPQDTGWALMLTAVAVAGRSLVGLALVALFAVFVQRLWRADDALLERRLGAPYVTYRTSTPAVAWPTSGSSARTPADA